MSSELEKNYMNTAKDTMQLLGAERLRLHALAQIGPHNPTYSTLTTIVMAQASIIGMLRALPMLLNEGKPE